MSEAAVGGYSELQGPATNPVNSLSVRFGQSMMEWLIVLSLLGYPLAALIGIYFGFVSHDVSVNFRILVLGLVFFAVVSIPATRLPLRPNITLVLFLFLYGARLAYDVPLLRTAGDDLKFYIATLIIPALPLLALSAAWDDRATSKIAAWFGALTSSCLMAAPVLAPGRFRVLTVVQGRFAYDVIDPITIGSVGAVTALAGLAAFSHARRPTPAAVAALVAGTICLALPLSRGPLLAFLGTLGVYLVLRRRWVWLTLILLGLVNLLLVNDSILTRYRLASLGREGSAQQRLLVMRYALKEIGEHPLLGVSTFEPTTGSYAHNIFLDAALSLGILGVILVVALLGKSLWRSVFLLGRGVYFLPMIVIYGILESQVSGAIWTSAGLWLPVTAILSLTPMAQGQRVGGGSWLPSSARSF